MRYPIIPSDDRWEGMDVDDMFEQITKSDVVEYLNEVIEYYGPPCEFCRYFGSICDLGLRKLVYNMRIGPFAEWHIRKFCDKHEGADNTDEQQKDQARAIRNQLNCAAQTYG